MNENYTGQYNPNNFTYEALTEDGRVIPVRSYSGTNLENLSKNELSRFVKENAIASGAMDVGGDYNFVMTNNDEENVLVNKQSITHTKSPNIPKARLNFLGDIVSLFSDAVKVNEAFRNGVYSSVYYTEAINNNKPYLIRFIVEDNVLKNYDASKLSAFSALEKRGTFTGSSPLSSSSNYNVPQLLEDINSIGVWSSQLFVEKFEFCQNLCTPTSWK